MELPIFKREHFNGNYRVDVYYITKQLAELPIYILTTCVFISVFYFMVGLNPDVDRFFMCMLIAVCLVQAVISFGKCFTVFLHHTGSTTNMHLIFCSAGYAVSCIANSLQMALGIAPPLMIPMFIFGGFFLNSE